MTPNNAGVRPTTAGNVLAHTQPPYAHPMILSAFCSPSPHVLQLHPISVFEPSRPAGKHQRTSGEFRGRGGESSTHPHP